MRQFKLKSIDFHHSWLVKKYSNAHDLLADSISESNPRVIDDTRARKLACDLKRCSYYETCATYGLNVERVFQDGKQRCCKIFQKYNH